ncbi:sigma-54 interaction domain-containing protein [Carboxydothermus ferrireducens]|uniref:PAS domain S-box-containing protein n=1 Tax=Carboxydothermus ferrireducens DSM 11255 TaxID=1119529 RepID=A0ABX2RAE2_9THEO|nr:sigma 54-interacting transcriptional regulator [Carboxydothermus ferrireducens]NYE58143.1 PAS domain S-box-containing protein [Carboxydothermus ferrireducens DSM 11255]
MTIYYLGELEPEFLKGLPIVKVQNVEQAVMANPDFFIADNKGLSQITDLVLAQKMREELLKILDSLQEGIEIADEKGEIKYINQAFTRITGIEKEERIGKNIFEVSPYGALAQAIKLMKPVIGHRTLVGGSKAEVVSNAVPIFIDGKLSGGAVVFQTVTDILKISEQLSKTQEMLESFSQKLSELSGCRYTFNDIIGKDEKLLEAKKIAKKAAKSDATVLLLGESGTGKEMFAQAIHMESSRSSKPFVKINCAAIPENLLESELFGYEKGAFTGATKTKMGKFELAHQGTIFLDEIGDLNLFLQAKLLRVLEDKQFERVGGIETITTDVRVIAATNRDLKRMVKEGKFREDLYFRLKVIDIELPPLRKRNKEDILLITENIIGRLNRRFGKKVKGLTPKAQELFQNYPWPGNIRELENLLERTIILVDDEYLDEHHFYGYFSKANEPPVLEKSFPIKKLADIEKEVISMALEKYGRSLSAKKMIAEKLGISLASLYNKIKRYNL